ncbi:NAD-dependent epimerase/dehydratase family protein [Ichthyenterobacterium sp. W332]|uniref:NAD-dependent epimerase/dehydratase family protein n=1 Tax=Microcosmobacter mediterraneus TaxID=3075607 RepID=A0ABU2YNC3_9FLAO|nr:NAD-dependent epimerase/dehydratase family protein [Ichthyenterobacterium sp. W332]MDT0559671.1 NAD-dependent epimerase/dehydratase family protein [Ichthyenterobacterium sp. W332]
MILVTGGTGLVGSHLLFKLVSNGETVRAIYRRDHKLKTVKHVFSYYSDDSESLFNSIEWVKANINDIPALQLAFKDVDFVYHCAAFVSFEPDKFDVLRKINIEGTANIVNLSLSFNVKKLCFVSSIAAIGEQPNSKDLITEQTPWDSEKDNSVYAISKYGAELEIWRGTQEGLDAVIINPGVILGPGYWHGGSSGSFFKRIHKGMSHYTEGITGYVDIWDVVNPMLKLMPSNIKNEGFILISENLSFKKFIENVATELHVKSPKKKASLFLLSVAWRLDWLSHKLFGKRRQLSKQVANTAHSITKYDNSKIRTALNYEFKSLDISIKDTCKFYLKDLK